MDTFNEMTLTSESKVLVLIADRDTRVRNALRALIEAEPGLAVAGEVSDIGEILQQGHIPLASIILVDPTLREAESILPALCTICRQQHRPVIVLSLREGMRERAMAAGATAFLEKGASAEEVLGALRRALRDRNTLAEMDVA